tara:strand:- start:2075 stop:4615 length:2541 start_codon:yes stop_codon:yes gene_type:complete
MKTLGHEIIEMALTESPVKTIIVVYPGRFQPMGQHHAAVYKKLASKFGKSNTYVVTSDVVKLPKSPLNFKEKYSVMKKHGVTNVVQVKNPYQAQELTSKYDPETTALLFAVGAKDMKENPRFKIGFKKNGDPSYFQNYEDNKSTLQPFTKHGYLVVAPHVNITIPGFGEMSGTTLRQVLATADAETFKDVMGFFDPKIYMMLQSKFSQIKSETIDSFLAEGSLTGLGDSSADDGPRYLYGNQATYRKKTAEMAKRLGYEVVNYIVKDSPLEIHDTAAPNGPVMTVSYFPTGVKGGDPSGTDYLKNYKGSPAYKLWKKQINKIATTVGYKFLDYLGAEDSIESSKDEKLGVPTGLTEDFNVPINIGDTVMMGKFKNKPVIVQTIQWSAKGDLLINGKSAARFRIPQKEDDQALTKEWWGDSFKDVISEVDYHSKLSRGHKPDHYQLGTSEFKPFDENNISEAKANTHLTHLEELILTQGKAGYKQAKSFLIELIKNLKGNSNAKVNTSVKWDGAPAMFVGINPDNGKFFVGTKSVFNKEPKINYTKDDVEMNHGHAPGLSDKLKKALDYLPSLGIKGILQGDFMFDSSMLKSTNIDGKAHYSFRPNTITYAVEADSDLGKQIAAAEFGIVFHTTYQSLQSGASYGANVSGLKSNSKVWFDDAFFKDTTGVVTLTAEEGKSIAANIKKADSVKINYDNIPSVLLNTYLNSEIRTGQFVDNPAISFKAFQKWYQIKVTKAVAKLKSDKGKAKAQAAGDEKMNLFNSKKQDIINIFIVSKLLAEAKMIFVEKYNNAVYNTKHFVDDGQGGLKVTAPEGYVAVDRIGNGVKLVDRLEFSRANFAMDKGFTK